MSSKSSSRRAAREYALHALYMADAREVDVQRTLAELWDALLDGNGIPEARAPQADEVEFATRLATGVETHLAEIDALIEQASTHWRVRRMPVVDRNILRLAAYELMACTDIPASVSCNEAIELAKRFGGAESRAFVNGLVDRMGRQLGRLATRSDKTSPGSH